MPTQGTRAEEVERLVGLGATVVSDERKPDGTGSVTMTDPEGLWHSQGRRADRRALIARALGLAGGGG
jgi:hypothetical protein